MAAMNNDGTVSSTSSADSTPEICGQFCCSDFYLFQDQQSLTTAGDALIAPIHPIFAKLYWENTSFSDYESLRMMLKVASRLLTTDAVVEFISTAIDGDLYIDVDPNASRPGKFVKPRPISECTYEPDEADDATGHNQIFQYGFFQRRYYKTDIDAVARGLSETRESLQHFQQRAALFRMPKRGWKTAKPAMRARANNVLLGMEGMLRFRVSNLRASKSLTNGRHQPMQGPLPQHHAALYPHGRMSRILLHNGNLIEMKEAQRAFANGEIDEIRLRSKELEVANTLIHELAHALNAASNSHLFGNRVGFRDNTCIEAGFDLVSHIYGGVMRESFRSFPLPKGPHLLPGDGRRKQYITMSEWPSGMKFASYIAGKHAIAKRGPLPATETLTRVPHTFVMKLFTNQFWMNHAANGRKSDLRVRGPRWTTMSQETVTTDFRLSSLVSGVPQRDLKKLLRIVTRQPGVKKALADLEDDLFIMSTMADAWPEQDKEPKVVSDARLRRSSRVLSKGDPQKAGIRKTTSRRPVFIVKPATFGADAKRRRSA